MGFRPRRGLIGGGTVQRLFAKLGVALFAISCVSNVAAQSPLAAASITSPSPFASQPTGVAAPEPVYWSQETFRIPYKWNSASDPNTTQSVKLYLSQNRGNTWNEISTAKPEVQFFTYHAPADGEYWFAMRTIDASGRANPAGPHQPELCVIVDTENPQVVSLDAQLSATGEVAATWQAGDRYLNVRDAKLQYRTPSDTAWREVTAGSLREPAAGMAAGEARWQVPPGTKSVWVRLAVRDRAGNGREAGAEARMGAAAGSQLASAGPLGPKLNPADTATAVRPNWTSQAATMRSPQQKVPPQTQAWPSDGKSAVPFGTPRRELTPTLTAPRIATDNTRALASPSGNHPLRQLPRTSSPAAAAPQGSVATNNPFRLPQSNPSRSLVPARTASASPFGGMRPPELEPSGQPPLATPQTSQFNLQPFQQNPYQQPLAVPARGASPSDATPIQQLGSFDFEIAYDVTTAGTFGVTRVELWATPDGGQSWKRIAVDNDNRSPVLGTVSQEGDYGLKVVVETAGGLEAIRPRPGDAPDMRVRIDTTPPQVKLTGIEQGTQHLASHLIVQWQTDSSQSANEIATLRYSSQPTGPWVVAASNLPNNGQYRWRLARHLPTQLYVRLEVEDQAGNVGADQTAVPVRIHLPNPTVRLESARAVGG